MVLAINPEKEDLRALLEEQVQNHLKREPLAIKRYASEPPPERRPWHKRPSPHEKAYSQMIEALSEQVE